MSRLVPLSPGHPQLFHDDSNIKIHDYLCLPCAGSLLSNFGSFDEGFTLYFPESVEGGVTDSWCLLLEKLEFQ